MGKKDAAPNKKKNKDEDEDKDEDEEAGDDDADEAADDDEESGDDDSDEAGDDDDDEKPSKKDKKGKGSGGNRNTSGLVPREPVQVPEGAKKKASKEVKALLERLDTARAKGNKKEQRKIRMALRKAGFRLSDFTGGKVGGSSKKEEAGEEE